MTVRKKMYVLTVVVFGIATWFFTVAHVFAESAKTTDANSKVSPLIINDGGGMRAITGSLLSKGGVVNAADYPDLQDAINALPSPGGIVFMPPGTYKLKKPLNLSNTYGSGDKTRWITLQGSGKMNTTIAGDFPDSVIIDMTRCGYSTMRDFTVAGRAKCMVLIGRDKTLAGGGGHFFENVSVRGDDCNVAVMDRGGEVNRFVNCEIYVNKPGATCLWFTPYEHLDIKSPYMGELGSPSTTELRLYGTEIYSFGLNTVGLRVNGHASDVSIIGGYFANSGFASIYLDGTKGNVGEIRISDLRIEGETGMYNIYAKGSVNHVCVTGCTFGSAGECIRYEDIPASERFDGNAAADSWAIRDSVIYISDQSAKDPAKATGSRYFDGPGGRAVFRLDKMRNCRIENIVHPAVSYRIIKKGTSLDKPEPKTQAEKEVAQVFALNESEVELKYIKPKMLVCEKEAYNNTISVVERSSVVFLGKESGNRIEALSDNGIRRTYLGAGDKPELQNLPVLKAKDIANPCKGDFALLKKDNNEPTLAFYDGKAWKYLAVQP